jgi:hypothetical protein
MGKIGFVSSEIWGLLGYYAASYGNCLPTFRDNVSIPSSRVKSPSVVNNCHRRRVIPQKTADFINIAAEAWNQGLWVLFGNFCYLGTMEWEELKRFSLSVMRNHHCLCICVRRRAIDCLWDILTAQIVWGPGVIPPLKTRHSWWYKQDQCH